MSKQAGPVTISELKDMESDKTYAILLDAEDPTSEAIVYGCPREVPVLGISYDEEYWKSDKSAALKLLRTDFGMTETEAEQAWNNLAFEGDVNFLTDGTAGNDGGNAVQITWTNVLKVWVAPTYKKFHEGNFRKRMNLMRSCFKENATLKPMAEDMSFRLVRSTRPPMIKRIR